MLVLIQTPVVRVPFVLKTWYLQPNGNESSFEVDVPIGVTVSDAMGMLADQGDGFT